MSLEFLQEVIRNYGYLALFIGTFLEGETILLLAGFAVQTGNFGLSLHGIILTAFVGSLAGDQTAFFVGRYFGNRFLRRREKWQERAARVHKLLERYHEVLILTFRFFYGLRNLTPFILGTTDISAKKFFVLNAIGAFVWAVAFGCIGYLFGDLLENVLESVLKEVHNVELIIFGVIALVVLIFWIRKMLRKK
ncbi:DedA family protein [Desulfovibrio sulfodismutans]|uniref:DedA family protein n=1 Tax=Desulfolutivibrio sulfodismutans TaxID=63561 RepID=A0A7K3NLM5_9BACT|nr:DedA family protein [Desulfolutivibrio sulfodismutans]NDY57091.1 DedA family protein [Desulfolutivibrio sulfodismutans]QLA11720.1 DedA family protein [Desulfolutivibrio sulfodismutans DSM 3696]